MTPSAKLGGFKILKDVVRLSLVASNQTPYFPIELCHLIAKEKINLPYITCVNEGHWWGLNIMVDSANGVRTSQLIENAFGKIFTRDSESVILSIFPHKNNPEITGTLFEVFDQEEIDPDAFANSPSAISVVLKRDMISKASNALFEPFRFSAYRTPADWKLAQKGKEQLYKEVVASYQEKRPKVYGLECQGGQELLQLKLNQGNMAQLGMAFKEFARMGLYLTFLSTSPGHGEASETLIFCLPGSETRSNTEIMNKILPRGELESRSPVSVFSMNGPHFGDRYGIVSELLHALNESGIDLMALGCTIASIIGVVPSHQIEPAIQAIQGCFEVPSIIRKEN
jgi:aspartokinase